MDVKTLYSKQRAFFETHATLNVSFRRTALKKLLQVIESKEEAILEALFLDLKKSEYEAFLTEVFFVKKEIKSTLSNLNSWTKTRRVASYTIGQYNSRQI